MRHLSASRLLPIACLTTLLLINQAQVSSAFPFPFNLNLNGLNGNSTSSSLHAQAQSQLPRRIGVRVRRAIARESGIPARRLRVVSAREQTWRDGCLGLGKPSELCSLALVQGWRVAVTDGSQTWIYRTNSTGRSLRQESQTGSSRLPQQVSDRILTAASQESGIPTEQLRIAQAEEKSWDGCLGIETGNTVCPQALIPGWRIVVTGNGKSWVYHLNSDGFQIRLNRFATAASESVRFLSELTAPLEDEVLFRSVASGDIAGYTYETVLLKSGQVIRSLLRGDQATFSPHLSQVSQTQVQQFEKLLQSFHSFDRLSYTSAPPIPNSITVTLSSQTGTTQYTDAVAGQLPPDLLTIVQAWGTIVGNS